MPNACTAGPVATCARLSCKACKAHELTPQCDRACARPLCKACKAHASRMQGQVGLKARAPLTCTSVKTDNSNPSHPQTCGTQRYTGPPLPPVCISQETECPACSIKHHNASQGLLPYYSCETPQLGPDNHSRQLCQHKHPYVDTALL
jgi:hypothetical protein